MKGWKVYKTIKELKELGFSKEALNSTHSATNFSCSVTGTETGYKYLNEMATDFGCTSSVWKKVILDGRLSVKAQSTVMTMTSEELSILLGGAKIELKLRRREVTERRAI